MSLAGAARCPACSATLRPGAPWCTLCYADLRPPEPEPPEPVRQPEPQPEPELEPEVLTPPAGVQAKHAFVPGGAGQERRSRANGAPTAHEPDVAGRGPAAHSTPGPLWPCTACHTQNPLSASECTACGAGFLAALRDDEPPLLVIPGIGDLARLSRVQRLALAAVVVLAIGLITLVLSVLTS